MSPRIRAPRIALASLLIAADAATPIAATASADASSSRVGASVTPSRPTWTAHPAQWGSVSVGDMDGAVTSSASFGDSTGASGFTHRSRDDGPCNISRLAYPAGFDSSPLARSAGAISVVGDATRPITLTPDSAGHYASATQSARPWRSGESVVISSAGATVPMFSTRLTYPHSVTIVSPAAIQPPSTLLIDRRRGLPVSWTGGAADGDVHVQIAQPSTMPDGSRGGVLIDCTFAASSGHGTVPPSSLAELVTSSGPPDSGNISPEAALVAISTVSQRTVMAGRYRVAISAIATAFHAIARVQ